MTANEALELLADVSDPDSEWEQKTSEALSVLRAVVEDYEKARPLMRAAMDTELELRAWVDAEGEGQTVRYNEVGDTDYILRAALAYREGRKP